MIARAHRTSGCLFSPRPLSSLVIALLLILVAAPRTFAQSQPNPPQPFPHGEWTTQDPMTDAYRMDPAAQRALEKRLKQMNDERQKQLVADTNRLVKMAAQLNAEINNAHQSELTADQLRRVAEIEKLAHTIRQKMSASMQGITPVIGDPGTMIPIGIQ